jgi:hypothetical protein
MFNTASCETPEYSSTSHRLFAIARQQLENRPTGSDRQTPNDQVEDTVHKFP